MPTLADYPRYPLLFGPSPIQKLERLTKHLGGATVWAKRDDCNSGLAFGGNKTRKLEYLVADALAQGCDTLVSIGGVQSNHTRQVAAAAAKVGLKCVLVQEHWVEWPDVVYDRVGNILMSRLMGAEVRLDPATFSIGFRDSWKQALADVEARGGKPYAIPAGASDHPLGGHGFAGWAFEVAEQERELGVFFDTIIVCSVTGSTQAGMIAGFIAAAGEQNYERAAQYLAWAAQLHEIGISVAYGGYHRHSAYIVNHADMPGFTREEQRRIAQLLLAHRRSLKKLLPELDESIGWPSVFALRVAVLLCQRRTSNNPRILSARAGDKKFRLAIDPAWLLRNPLTNTVLREEIREWEKIGFDVKISGLYDVDDGAEFEAAR